jgi:hypothetical protein
MEESDLKRCQELESALAQDERMHAELPRDNDTMKALIANEL